MDLTAFVWHDAVFADFREEADALVFIMDRVRCADTETPVACRVQMRCVNGRVAEIRSWESIESDSAGVWRQSSPERRLRQEQWRALLQEAVGQRLHDVSCMEEGVCLSINGDEPMDVLVYCESVTLQSEKPQLPEGLRWLFFDVGSTLVDETEAYNHRIREMIAGTEVTFAQFQQKRFAFARQNLRGDLEAAQYFGLRKTPWHHEDERPYPGAGRVLSQLKVLGYHIGIIANQSAGTAERLQEWGLLQHIDLVAASAEAGVAKPDPAIFRLALNQAGCAPGEAAMIGDRLDNDIAPARALGMYTVWLPQGPAVWQSPRCEAETPHAEVGCLEELLGLFPGCDSEGDGGNRR